MSYIQFQQQCDDCHERWNAAFGIVGMTQIAAPPTSCPRCKSPRIRKVGDGWASDNPKRDAAIAAEC